MRMIIILLNYIFIRSVGQQQYLFYDYYIDENNKTIIL